MTDSERQPKRPKPRRQKNYPLEKFKLDFDRSSDFKSTLKLIFERSMAAIKPGMRLLGTEEELLKKRPPAKKVDLSISSY